MLPVSLLPRAHLTLNEETPNFNFALSSERMTLSLSLSLSLSLFVSRTKRPFFAKLSHQQSSTCQANSFLLPPPPLSLDDEVSFFRVTLERCLLFHKPTYDICLSLSISSTVDLSHWLIGKFTSFFLLLFFNFYPLILSIRVTRIQSRIWKNNGQTNATRNLPQVPK